MLDEHDVRFSAPVMHIPFVNRELELGELDSARRHGGLLVVYGRRRVGKTRLLRRWLDAHDGLYSQAIEAPRDIQIQQVYEDLRSRLTTEVVPGTWSELFELLRVQAGPWTLCLDEFPYLVAPDPTDAKCLLVAEVKWRKLSTLEHRRALAYLTETWERCSLRHRHPRVRFEILDSGALGR